MVQIADVRTYRYYDPATLSLDTPGMLEDLANAPEGAVVLLHTTGHNPCGFDPSQEEWRAVAGVCQVRVKEWRGLGERAVVDEGRGGGIDRTHTRRTAHCT